MFIDFTARAAHCRSGSIGDGSEEQKGAAEGLLEYRKILAGVKLLRQIVLAVMDWSKQRSDHLRDHLQRKRRLAGASLTGTTLSSSTAKLPFQSFNRLCCPAFQGCHSSIELAIKQGQPERDRVSVTAANAQALDTIEHSTTAAKG